jgi:hypothetical protein
MHPSTKQSHLMLSMLKKGRYAEFISVQSTTWIVGLGEETRFREN